MNSFIDPIGEVFFKCYFKGGSKKKREREEREHRVLVKWEYWMGH